MDEEILAIKSQDGLVGKKPYGALYLDLCPYAGDWLLSLLVVMMFINISLRISLTSLWVLD
jgi:predicted YcjX-like family ATPase